VLPVGWGLARLRGGRPNGSDAKLHGQGPRAEARAARGALHVRRANARRVTPRGFDVPSRLGRRAEAGPCQLLRRVGPRGLGLGRTGRQRFLRYFLRQQLR